MPAPGLHSTSFRMCYTTREGGGLGAYINLKRVYIYKDGVVEYNGCENVTPGFSCSLMGCNNTVNMRNGLFALAYKNSLILLGFIRVVTTQCLSPINCKERLLPHKQTILPPIIARNCWNRKKE